MSPRLGFQGDVSQPTSYIKYIQIARCLKPKLVAKCALASLPRMRVQIVRCPKPKLLAKCTLVPLPREGGVRLDAFRNRSQSQSAPWCLVQKLGLRLYVPHKPCLVARCAFVSLPRRGFQIARCPKRKLVAKCALISGPELEASNVGIGSVSLTGQPFIFHVARSQN